jgi:two-component system OmpR family sensor kinase/two-component system sensor histidine kinase QseC
LNSIRNRLLLSLFALLALATLVMGGLTYRNVLAEAEALSDYQLRQMALSLRDQGELAPAQASAMADEQLEFVIQIWTVDGRVIYATRPPSALPSRALLGFANIDVGNQSWRTFSVATPSRVIQVAQPRQVRSELAARAAWRGVLPMLLAAPLMLLLAAWLVAQALQPLRRVADEVRRRDEQSLAPLPDAGLPDEVAPLVNALNTLLARLQQALGTQRAFVADAAHELRSPLTALRLQLQVQGRARDEATRNEATRGLAASIERASRLVEQLLALARNEPGATATVLASLDLREVVLASLADVRAFADQRASTLDLMAGAPVNVAGDRGALALLVRNLADNALRYSPPGTRVEVRVLQEGGAALLQVDDAGPGIPADDRERVFDRFYRRASGDETGSGLGLAIVRGIAERHGAKVTIGDSPLGGLRVTVRFAPAAGGPGA